MWLQALVYSALYGVCAFLPVSLSAHAAYILPLFSGQLPTVCALAVSVGLLIAVTVSLRTTALPLAAAFGRTVSAPFRRNIRYDRREVRNASFWKLLYAAAAALATGLLLRGPLHALFDSRLEIGIALVVSAALLSIALRARGDAMPHEMHAAWAVVTGALCGLGYAVPGCSPVIMAFLGLRLAGVRRDASLRYAVLITVPYLLVSIGAQCIRLIGEGLPVFDAGTIAALCIGLIVTGAAAFFALHLCERAVRREKLWWFSLYALVTGLLSMLFFFLI